MQRERPLIGADPPLDEPGGREPVDEPRGARVGQADDAPERVDRLPGGEPVERGQGGRSRKGDTARMSDHVYKSIEVTGSSTAGVKEAIDRAVAKASETVRNLDWFEVLDIRGHLEDGKVAHYQVTLKIGFRLED